MSELREQLQREDTAGGEHRGGKCLCAQGHCLGLGTGNGAATEQDRDQ